MNHNSLPKAGGCLLKSPKRYKFEIVMVTFSYTVAKPSLQRFLALSTLCFYYHLLHFRNTILLGMSFALIITLLQLWNYPERQNITNVRANQKVWETHAALLSHLNVLHSILIYLYYVNHIPLVQVNWIKRLNHHINNF